jgi:hypothetical protein
LRSSIICEAETNRATKPLLEAFNQRANGPSREIDLPELRPLPEKPYQFATWKTAR